MDWFEPEAGNQERTEEDFADRFVKDFCNERNGFKIIILKCPLILYNNLITLRVW